MTADLLTLCHDASENSGAQLSIDRAFVRIGLRTLPIPYRCMIVARVRFEASEEGEHTFAAKIIDPDGEPLVELPAIPIECRMWPDESFGFGVFRSPCEWVVSHYGEYSIILYIDGQEQVSQFHIRRYPQEG
jgi:hypothetical protein